MKILLLCILIFHAGPSPSLSSAASHLSYTQLLSVCHPYSQSPRQNCSKSYRHCVPSSQTGLYCSRTCSVPVWPCSLGRCYTVLKGHAVSFLFVWNEPSSNHSCCLLKLMTALTAVSLMAVSKKTQLYRSEQENLETLLWK